MQYTEGNTKLTYFECGPQTIIKPIKKPVINEIIVTTIMISTCIITFQHQTTQHNKLNIILSVNVTTIIIITQ